MDQVKIGAFIAELRKEYDMTQRQLAESIGVSDKTVSKWECGNGLPELSTIPELCKVLHINMNELLSGERLGEEEYSMKAEENMMTLMQETEEHKKKNTRSLVTMILCLAGVAAVLILALTFGVGSSSVLAFIDYPSLIMLVVPTLLVLAAAGLLKAFFRAFALLGRAGNQYTQEQWKQASCALRLGAKTLLTVGSVETIAVVILLLGNFQHDMPVGQLLANVAIASLTMLYAVLGYLVLLPIRYKLVDSLEDEETE